MKFDHLSQQEAYTELEKLKNSSDYNGYTALKTFMVKKGWDTEIESPISNGNGNGVAPEPPTQPPTSPTPKTDDGEEPQEEDTPFFNGKKFIPMGMQSYLIKQGLHYASISNEPELRVYQDGLYLKEENKAKKDFRLLKAMQKALGGETFKMSQFNEVEQMLKRDITPMSECDPQGYLNVKNGILNLKTLELTPHSPDTIFLSQLPINFDKKADCPAIDAWLTDVLEGDTSQVKLFYEAVGYTLLQSTALQKMFILLGPSQTGKSTAGKLLLALLGDNNCSSLSLREIDDEDKRFTRSGLFGKIANISADISHRYLQGDGNIKRITAGETITAEFKGKNPFQFAPTVTLWAMANKMPASADKSSGWYQRLLILEFKKQFLTGTANPPDPNILEKLTTNTELSGLLNVSLACGMNLLEQKCFTMTEKQTRAIEAVMEQNDHVFGFCQSIEKIKGDWEDDNFYRNYKDWLAHEDSEAKPLSKRKLAEAVKLHGFTRRRTGGHNSSQRVFTWQKTS